MAAPLAVTAPSSLQNSMKSSSRRFDGKSRSLDDRDYIISEKNYQIFNREYWDLYVLHLHESSSCDILSYTLTCEHVRSLAS